jgi:hypothetical protein
MNPNHQKYDYGSAGGAGEGLPKPLDRPLRRRLYEGLSEPYSTSRKEALLQAAEGCKSVGSNTRVLLVALLALVLFVAGCSGGEEKQGDSTEETTTKDRTRKEGTKKGKESTGSGQEVTLSLDGDAGTEFSGTCSIGGEEESFEGQVPENFSYDLGGQQLECEIQKQDGDGTLDVLLTGPGDLIRQQIGSSGGTINLTYSENGGSSSSTSSSGSSSSVNQVVSSSSSGSSSSSSSTSSR